MSNETKKTALPKLRFPEFRDEPGWPEVILAENLYEHRSKSDGKSEVHSVSVHKGIINQIEHLGRSFSAANTSKYNLVKPFDIVYTKSPTGDFPYGVVKQNLTGRNVIVSPLYGVFKPTNEYVGNLVHAYFEDPGRTNNYLVSLIQKGAKNTIQISNDRFLSKEIYLPDNEGEQQKIATTLSSLDDLITAHSAKLTALHTHKRGLMQSLFPAEGETMPKLRFPEFQGEREWEKLPIGGKVDLLSGYPFKSAEISEDATGIPLMRGINVTSGFVRHNKDIDRYFIGNPQKLEKYKLRTDDLVIGMDGSKVGKNSALITELDSGALLIQRVARLRAKLRTSIQFIYQQINSSSFHNYVDRVNTSGGIPHISASQINEFEICFPRFEEQQRIASCLSSLDDRITAQSQKIESLKLHKKGLMQDLFPAAYEPAA